MRKKKRLPKILASILGVFAICGLFAGAYIVSGDKAGLPVSVGRKNTVSVDYNGANDYSLTYSNEFAIYTTPGDSNLGRNVTWTTFDGNVRLSRGTDPEHGDYWRVMVSNLSVSAPGFGTLWSRVQGDGSLTSGWDYMTALAGGLSFGGISTGQIAYDFTGVRYAYVYYQFSVDNAQTLENIPSSGSTRPIYKSFGIYFSQNPVTDWDNLGATSFTFGTKTGTATFTPDFTTPLAYKEVKSTYTYSGYGKYQIGRRIPLLCLDFSLWTNNQGIYDQGYQAGYDKGYSDGDSTNENMATIFSGIIDIGLLPINVFLDIFNFEVFGINFKPLVAGLLTALVAIIIFRMFVGKGGSGGE